jgi:hypothetical protein
MRKKNFSAAVLHPRRHPLVHSSTSKSSAHHKTSFNWRDFRKRESKHFGCFQTLEQALALAKRGKSHCWVHVINFLIKTSSCVNQLDKLKTFLSLSALIFGALVEETNTTN